MSLIEQELKEIYSNGVRANQLLQTISENTRPGLGDKLQTLAAVKYLLADQQRKLTKTVVQQVARKGAAGTPTAGTSGGTATSKLLGAYQQAAKTNPKMSATQFVADYYRGPKEKTKKEDNYPVMAAYSGVGALLAGHQEDQEEARAKKTKKKRKGMGLIKKGVLAAAVAQGVLDTVFPGEAAVSDNFGSWKKTVVDGANAQKDLSTWFGFFPLAMGLSALSKGVF